MIITVITDGNEVWLGHNSTVVLDHSPISEDQNPWIYFGDWVLGVTGERYVRQFLETNIDKLEKGADSVSEVVRCLAEMLIEENLYSEDDDSAAPSFNIYCVLANIDGRVYDLDDSFSVTKIPNGKAWARGDGIDYVLGADHVVREIQPELPNEERLKIVMEAAMANDIDCPGKAIIAKLIGDKK